MPEARLGPEALPTQLETGLSLGHHITEATAQLEALITEVEEEQGQEAPQTEETEQPAQQPMLAEQMEVLQPETEEEEEQTRPALTEQTLEAPAEGRDETVTQGETELPELS